MNIKSKTKTPFPTKQQVRTFIEESDGPVGKREIAKAFNIKGADRIPLKKLLKELVVEGGLEQGRKRELSPKGTLPAVAVIEMIGLNEEGEAIAKPLNLMITRRRQLSIWFRTARVELKPPAKVIDYSHASAVLKMAPMRRGLSEPCRPLPALFSAFLRKLQKAGVSSQRTVK